MSITVFFCCTASSLHGLREKVFLDSIDEFLECLMFGISRKIAVGKVYRCGYNDDQTCQEPLTSPAHAMYEGLVLRPIRAFHNILKHDAGRQVSSCVNSATIGHVLLEPDHSFILDTELMEVTV